ncbi:hypothetical protein D3C79_565450 [compost metagenome]
MVLTISGIRAPPTLWAVFQADHQKPRSVLEYQLVSSLEQGGQPQPWKKALAIQSATNIQRADERPNNMLMTPVAISPSPMK